MVVSGSLALLQHLKISIGIVVELLKDDDEGRHTIIFPFIITVAAFFEIFLVHNHCH